METLSRTKIRVGQDEVPVTVIASENGVMVEGRGIKVYAMTRENGLKRFRSRYAKARGLTYEVPRTVSKTEAYDRNVQTMSKKLILDKLELAGIVEPTRKQYAVQENFEGQGSSMEWFWEE